MLVAQLHFALGIGVIALLAAGMRRWWLSGVALVGAVTLGGATLGVSAGRAPEPSGPTLRVVSANVYYQNDVPTDAAADIAAHGADLILLQEWTPAHIAAFDEHLSNSHPYRLSHPASDPGGFAIYSKYPFRLEPMGDEVVDWQTRRLRLRWNGTDLIVYNVRPGSPGSTAGVHANRHECRAIAHALDKESLPTIVAGDFNHTPNTCNATAMRDAGFVGGGGGATWPYNRRLAWMTWPRFRIDDILVGNGLGVRPLGTANTSGADHRAVVAEVGLAN